RNVAVGGYSQNEVTTGFANVSVGVNSLAYNSSGERNTAIGDDALMYNTTGSSNNAFGDNALLKNIVGDNNTAIGKDALLQNLASENTAVGNYALSANTSGTVNTAVGVKALKENITGEGNTAMGYDALSSNTTGFTNVAVGQNTLKENTTGTGNTAVGYKSGEFNVSGGNNTFIGNNTASVSGTIINNATAIGANSIVTISNTIQLGDSNVTLVNTSGIVSTTGILTSGTVTATKFVGDGSGLTGISGPIYKSSMVLQSSSTAAADSQIDLPGLSFRWRIDSNGVGVLEVKAESGNAPQALIFYFSYHTDGNNTINFRPDTTNASSSSWTAVDESWGNTLPSIAGYYSVYEFDFSVYPLNSSGNHFGKTYNVKILLGGWGGVHMRAFYQ
ncbi:hypothetical protein OAQ04_04820, partial [Flavobacteriaceae bacterium]|nr:hypothetical protein [Flavobacteriaceae bacterium]